MVKQELKDNIIGKLEKIKGEIIKIKVHLGRKKYISFLGTVIEVYPNLFTIKDINDCTLRSFTFSDIIMKNVILIKSES